MCCRKVRDSCGRREGAPAQLSLVVFSELQIFLTPLIVFSKVTRAYTLAVNIFRSQLCAVMWCLGNRALMWSVNSGGMRCCQCGVQYIMQQLQLFGSVSPGLLPVGMSCFVGYKPIGGCRWWQDHVEGIVLPH